MEREAGTKTAGRESEARCLEGGVGDVLAGNIVTIPAELFQTRVSRV